MRWPWQKRPAEHRQETFTSLIEAGLLATATGAAVDARATGVIEAAASAMGRALASAHLKPASMLLDLFTPELRMMVGRELVTRGQAVLLLGPGVLYPVASWDIRGTHDPRTWLYRCDLPGPSSWNTVLVPGSQVLDFRWQVAADRPWSGVSPVTASGATGTLLAGLEAMLSNEAGAASGYLLPTPPFDQNENEEEDPAITKLKADIAKLKGRTSLVETTQGGWDQGHGQAPQGDWVSRRIGANPPQSLVALRENAALHALAATGFPPSLLGLAPGDAREAYRRWAYTAVEPVATIIAAELERKLMVRGVTFDFDSLRAGDIAAKARAFGAMVQGGVPVDKALALSGLLVNEDT